MEKKRMIGVEWVEFLKNHPTPELKQKLDEIYLRYHGESLQTTIWVKKPGGFMRK